MFVDITPEERKILLVLARAAIADRFEGRETALPESKRLMALELGAFVTLTRSDRLRGCIGRMEGDEPLPPTIRSMALAAAFGDPRFPPLVVAEMADLQVEITLLGPRRPISRVEEIEVGKHGVFIRKGPHQAVFLPQVATEQGWDRERLLTQLCRKAGLPDEAWSDEDAALMIFEGLGFSEDDPIQSREN